MAWFICLAFGLAEALADNKDSLKDKGNPVSFPLYFMSVLRHNLWIALAALLLLIVVALTFACLRIQANNEESEKLTEKGGLVLRGRKKRQPRVRWYGVLSDDKKSGYGGCDFTDKLMCPSKLEGRLY